MGVGSRPWRVRVNSGVRKMSSISRSALVTAGWERLSSAATRETERWRSSASSSGRCRRRRRETTLWSSLSDEIGMMGEGAI
ncbi:hypothetical protein D3C85_1414430 [compost metagenome]